MADKKKQGENDKPGSGNNNNAVQEIEDEQTDEYWFNLNRNALRFSFGLYMHPNDWTPTHVVRYDRRRRMYWERWCPLCRTHGHAPSVCWFRPGYRDLFCSTCTRKGHHAENCKLRLAHLERVFRAGYLKERADPLDIGALSASAHEDYHPVAHGSNYWNYRPNLNGPAPSHLPVAPHRRLYAEFEENELPDLLRQEAAQLLAAKKSCDKKSEGKGKQWQVKDRRKMLRQNKEKFGHQVTREALRQSLQRVALHVISEVMKENEVSSDLADDQEDTEEDDQPVSPDTEADNNLVPKQNTGAIPKQRKAAKIVETVENPNESDADVIVLEEEIVVNNAPPPSEVVMQNVADNRGHGNNGYGLPEEATGGHEDVPNDGRENDGYGLLEEAAGGHEDDPNDDNTVAELAEDITRQGQQINELYQSVWTLIGRLEMMEKKVFDTLGKLGNVRFCQ